MEILDNNIIENVDAQIVPVKDEQITQVDTIQESLSDDMFKVYSNLKEDYKTVIKYKLEGLNNVEIAKLMGITKQWVGVLMKNVNVRKVLATLQESQLLEFNDKNNAKKIALYSWVLDEYEKLYKEAEDIRTKKSILDSIERVCRIESPDNIIKITENKSMSFPLPK